MTDERFMELVRGPLYHPVFPFVMTRLTLALTSVVLECGKPGADALEVFCEDYAPEKRGKDGVLTNERFNELLNGPLHGESLFESVQKTAAALKYVVDTCEEFGELSLESHCEDRERMDHQNEESHSDATGFSEE